VLVIREVNIWVDETWRRGMMIIIYYVYTTTPNNVEVLINYCKAGAFTKKRKRRDR